MSSASRSVAQGYRLHLFQAPRSEIVRPARRRKTGESKSGAAEPLIISLNDRSGKNQLLAYPLIGQIWQIISTLSKRVVPVTQKDGMRRPRAWNRRIHDNSCVEQMFTRFTAHRSAEDEERTEEPALWTWREEKVFLQSSFPFPLFAPPTFRVPFTFASSSLSESLEQAIFTMAKQLKYGCQRP